jgi:superfamily I DNA and/or RNA helicase
VLSFKAKYDAWPGQKFSDRDGTTCLITEDDILVVTVDKFQGQEVPIMLISMVTSNAESLPYNIEFLYSRNRLSLAVSCA